jgi:hypothetical protein
MDMRCRITSGGGDPRESATENVDRLGRNPAARVKRCGKSAPRLRQRRRHGKPHREQDRIGAARGEIPGSMSGSAARVGCSRRRATGGPEEWPSRARCVLALRRTEPGLQAGWRDTGRSAQNRRAPHQFGDLIDLKTTGFALAVVFTLMIGLHHEGAAVRNSPLLFRTTSINLACQFDGLDGRQDDQA